ncbi:MAG: DUF167 domain-containing protein [bacterium]|nr:DUF167 domain-containing protein [bacterium]
MKLFLNVKTKAKEQKIEQLAPHKLKVWLKSAPEKGMANNELIDVLAKHFGVTRAQVIIRAGHASSGKIVEIS